MFDTTYEIVQRGFLKNSKEWIPSRKGTHFAFKLGDKTMFAEINDGYLISEILKDLTKFQDTDLFEEMLENAHITGKAYFEEKIHNYEQRLVNMYYKQKHQDPADLGAIYEDINNIKEFFNILYITKPTEEITTKFFNNLDTAVREVIFEWLKEASMKTN